MLFASSRLFADSGLRPTCTQVTVLVMAAGSETVALGDRMGWLRASCADLPGVTE
ncbi:MAG TPA: hypothetical protein VME44_15705 [Streptosporangiaceae bacterium]|nr:hypothetical protein [Streptosporangiaceae bacterium]